MEPLSNSNNTVTPSTITATQAWWKQTKSTEANLVAWLKKQYHGEVTAAARVSRFAEVYCTVEGQGSYNIGKYHNLLNKIAADEAKHARWIGELLDTRGVVPEVLDNHEERYWTKTLGNITSFESGAAVAAHAEAMRLERIIVIKNDVTTPFDVRNTFALIANDEVMHAKAFAVMAGDQALKDALTAHKDGLQALGLIVDVNDN